jgi:hypothetical protein
MTSLAICLPESILNEIFEYLSHITDSGWILKIDRKGKLCLVARDTFTPNIDHINFYKRHLTMYAGRINLLVDKGGANWDLQPVVAFSQPILSNYKEVMYDNYAHGFFYRNACLQYEDPDTGSSMIAYVDLRVNHNYGTEEVVFHQGCVYDDQGNSFVITGYGSDASMTRIVVNPFNMIWDTTGDLDAVYDDMYEFGLVDDIILEDNQPLHMYM